ncbi:MAG: glycosyl transferase family 2 [Clostridia bacterium]|nr:glycosyl transferase family 2 [Clostridia bacterium]
MKVYVYAICKNESRFVENWMSSMAEADNVYVLDVGSEDESAWRLKNAGAVVKTEKVIPWRFDEARNMSLEMVPKDADICVCTDICETFNAGWREKLEASWKNGATRAICKYIIGFDKEANEDKTAFFDRIHAREGFVWARPAYEKLVLSQGAPPETRVYADGVTLYRREKRPKPHGEFVSLLEAYVREDPHDAEGVFYLGREYMYCGKWDMCIKTMIRHLSMPGVVWPGERCASMLCIARAYEEKGDAGNAQKWFLRAAAEGVHLSEPHRELARFLSKQGELYGAIYFKRRARLLNESAEAVKTGLNSKAWGIIF